MQRRTFEMLLGSVTNGEQWKQAQLPFRLGGVGMRTAVGGGAAASYVMSRALTRESCHALDPNFIHEGEVHDDISVGLRGAVESVNGKLPPEQQIGDGGSLTYEHIDCKWLVLNNWVEEESAKRMIDDSMGSEFEAARLNAVQAQSSAAFLDGTPSKAAGTLLTGDEFRSRLGRRLGVEICEEGMCPCCGQAMDRFRAHAEGSMCGGDKTKSHNQVNYLVYKQCQSAGVRPELEKTEIFSGAKSQQDLGRRRPADTFLHSGAGIKTGKGEIY